ncbi:hypothetical protein [Nitrospira sp. Kam-Ns4a]
MHKSQDLKRLSKLLFIGGTVFFLIRIDIGVAKPTEYVFSLAVLAGTLHLASSTSWKKLSGHIVLMAAAVVFAVLLGTAWGSFAYGLEFNSGGIRLLLKLLLNVWVFLVLLIWLREDRKFYRSIALGMSIPYVVYIVALALPERLQLLLLNEPDIRLGRFQGVSYGVGSMAFPLAEAFGFAYALWLTDIAKASKRQWVLMIVATSIVGLELWTASRIGLLALIASMFVGPMLVARSMSAGYAGAFRIGARSLALAVLLAFVSWEAGLLNFTEIAVIRVSGVVPGEMEIGELIRNGFDRLTDPEINIRLVTYSYYQHLALANPLGMGVNYFERYAVNVGGEQLPPDSFMDTLIHGGFLLAAVMFVFVLTAMNRVSRRIKDNSRVGGNAGPYLVGAATALVANLVFTAFGGFPIYSLRFWIILAMCLV